MSTPNPLVPMGTVPDQSKSRIRYTFIAIIALHAVLFGSMLIAGCNKTEPPPVDAPLTFTNPLPVWPEATNLVPAVPIASNPIPPIPPPTGNILTPPIPSLNPQDTLSGTTGMSEHTIVKGEILATIAKKYKVGWKSIVDANPGLDPTRLKIGQKIKIPPPKAGSAGVAASGGNGDNAGAASISTSDKSYTVRSGDNLMKIASGHGVSVKALRSANGLKTDRITVGQKLKIPAKASATPVVSDPIPGIPALPPVNIPPVPQPGGNQ